MRPIVIAHRGASGHLPEHTLQSKALAVAMRSDYLEQDIVATRDDQLVVLHDIHLDRVTNVAAQFPDRAREDGRFYARDFDLSEILTLTVNERVDGDGNQAFPRRRAYTGAGFRVHTLARELELVELLRRGTGQELGIYPEIKYPAWHQQQGVDISQLVLETLRRFGYSKRVDTCYLQCFDESELRRIRFELGSELKLVQLIGDDSWSEEPTNFAAMQTPDGLTSLANTVDGIGPWINQLYALSDGRIKPAGLVGHAHDRGLVVHPYTFRSDAVPEGFADMDALLHFAVGDLAVDGLFTDFPDAVQRFLSRLAK
jgi:glycerophosphoryl diester phosphodiesterase